MGGAGWESRYVVTTADASGRDEIGFNSEDNKRDWRFIARER